MTVRKRTARRSKPDHEKLLRAISAAIKRSKCSYSQVVDVLISSAAGIAVTNQTHSCDELSATAHNMWHDARQVVQESVEIILPGAGGFEN